MRLRILSLCLALITLLPPAWASGGGGASVPQPMVFTVNLGVTRYLRVEMMLETANPEAAHELEMFKPRIQHQIILLLSERDEAVVRTLPGKKALMDDIVDAVNHLIHSTTKDGVSEVLFTSFIIQ